MSDTQRGTIFLLSRDAQRGQLVSFGPLAGPALNKLGVKEVDATSRSPSAPCE